MSDDLEESAYRQAYPEALSDAEKAFISVSRKGRLPDAPDGFHLTDCTGVGLSGGGIRSATFSLGIFQGLARLKLLRKIDFLSTVSGGGYFGSFYTRFFLRKEVASFSFVEDTLDADCPIGKTPYQRNIITWLRENGRYLSPRGSGDLLLAGAVLLRNWVVVQLVLGVLLLLLFLTAQALRLQLDAGASFHFDLDSWFRQLGFLKHPNSELVINLPGRLQLWVTPLVIVPEAVFLLAALPFGWAYWIVGRHPHVKKRAQFYKHPVTGVVFVIVLAVLALVYSDACRALAAGVLLVTAITLISALASLPKDGRPTAEEKAKHDPLRNSYRDEVSRNRVSAQLKAALVLAVAALAFVVVDSLGQTIYLVLLTPGATLKSWAGGLLALIVALAPFANRIMMVLRGADVGKRPKGLATIAATVAALAIIGTLLTALSVGANAIAWKLNRPSYAPEKIGRSPLAKLSDAEVVPDKDQPNQWRMQNEEPPPPPTDAPARDKKVLGGAWLISLVLSFLFGQSWPFLNRSTQLPLYSARLTRAYLGASNPRRTGKDPSGDHSGGAVTRVIPGDDSEMEGYWPWPPAQQEDDTSRAALAARQQNIYRHGAPLHLINVTVNETLDGKSQVQQQDRKGMGMAVGPAGISAGVRHHAVFDRARERFLTFPREGFKVFDYGEGGGFTGERLTVGQWLSISGAAFSTGLGARTSLALSLLTGVGNIRLGYWWDSGVPPETRPERERPIASRLIGEVFTRIFPVQSYLLDEYTARYHGTARKEWYLTDGGHFENLAGYELIRRRLRLIIIVDSEADPDYNFGGLAGLIRKARIDFGAEISFLDDARLNEVMEGHRHAFSSLENLRRGKWIEESTPVLNREEATRRLIDPVDYRRFSLAHAAIATVSYDGKPYPESCLIYLKPTLLGKEPLDILQYHVENPTFPQQSTMDQFFDEAQWESYRRLGQHIAREVFRAPEGREVTEWWDSRVAEVLKTPVKICTPPGAGRG